MSTYVLHVCAQSLANIQNQLNIHIVLSAAWKRATLAPGTCGATENMQKECVSNPIRQFQHEFRKQDEDYSDSLRASFPAQSSLVFATFSIFPFLCLELEFHLTPTHYVCVTAMTKPSSDLQILSHPLKPYKSLITRYCFQWPVSHDN